jgi:hypothetical protein
MDSTDSNTPTGSASSGDASTSSTSSTNTPDSTSRTTTTTESTTNADGTVQRTTTTDSTGTTTDTAPATDPVGSGRPTSPLERPDDVSTTAGGASATAGGEPLQRPVDTGAQNDPNSAHPADVGGVESGSEATYVERVTGKAPADSSK